MHLLRASVGLTKVRQGHTELATVLVEMAGLIPSATICEMMGDHGKALHKDDARKYAEDHGLVYIDGKDIVEAYTG